ncbi:hypothetical protein N7492_002979, partial [Penicillium capsulatum]
YLNYSDIDQSRRKKLQPRDHPGGGHNAAGSSLFRKKLSRITPEDWSQDPYLVCVMLSIAQLQERLLQPSPQITAYTPRLLMTHFADSDFIYLYESRVTSKLLRMLNNPTTAISEDWPTIEPRKIPFKPYENFKQRLMHELLSTPDKPLRCGSSVADAHVDALVGTAVKRQHETKEEDRRILRRKL